jgi:hypothetical protein
MLKLDLAGRGNSPRLGSAIDLTKSPVMFADPAIVYLIIAAGFIGGCFASFQIGRRFERNRHHDDTPAPHLGSSSCTNGHHFAPEGHIFSDRRHRY